MSTDDLKKLPIQDISDYDCMLFMWTTMPHLPNALSIMKSWGFEYKTSPFVWIKNDKSTNTLKKFGLGYYTQSNAEQVLLGTKGNYWRESRNVKQVIQSSIKEHSRKPDEVRNRIVRLCGDLPRIELFARTRIHGWDVWGNDKRLQLEPLEKYLTFQVDLQQK